MTGLHFYECTCGAFIEARTVPDFVTAVNDHNREQHEDRWLDQ